MYFLVAFVTKRDSISGIELSHADKGFPADMMSRKPFLRMAVDTAMAITLPDEFTPATKAAYAGPASGEGFAQFREPEVDCIRR